MKFILIPLLLTSVGAPASDLYNVGVRDFTYQDQTRSRSIQTHVWYPVDAKTSVQPMTTTGPLAPVVGARKAPLAKNTKNFPVVLFSHGSMGSGSRLFWLAEPLVKQGFIAIAVDHPGNMFGDSSADGVMRVWDRAKDLTFALDQVLNETEFSSRIDQTNISAIGHSVGGTTVLLLGGAKFSFDKFSTPTPDCEGSKDPFYRKQCAEFKRIDPKHYGKSVIEGDYSDKRIKAVIALDPGFARSLEPQSLQNLKSKTFVFIADKLADTRDQIHSRDFTKLLSDKRVEVVPDSVHMTFLGPCKEKVSQEDPEIKQLCADREQKLEIQKKVVEKVETFLNP